MYIHHGTVTIDQNKKYVITIGSYDGVHTGHRVILDRLKREAHNASAESVVVTFEPHPRILLRPDDHKLQLLNTLEEKADLIASLGIDHLVIIPFTRSFSNLSPQEYVESFLVQQLCAHTIIIGYDHRFGKDRAGNVSFLQDYADRGSFKLIQIDPQIIDHVTVSSTKIREQLSLKNLGKAHQLLSYPYPLSGTVVHGDHIGRTIGYPTANIQLSNKHKLIPPEGIYAVQISGDTFYKKDGMLYIGNRPTLHKTVHQQKNSIEVHIFNLSEDLYGRRLRIDILKHIRDDKKFEGLEALKHALEQDEITTRKFFQSYREET